MQISQERALEDLHREGYSVHTTALSMSCPLSWICIPHGVCNPCILPSPNSATPCYSRTALLQPRTLHSCSKSEWNEMKDFSHTQLHMLSIMISGTKVRGPMFVVGLLLMGHKRNREYGEFRLEATELHGLQCTGFNEVSLVQLKLHLASYCVNETWWQCQRCPFSAVQQLATWAVELNLKPWILQTQTSPVIDLVEGRIQAVHRPGHAGG